MDDGQRLRVVEEDCERRDPPRERARVADDDDDVGGIVSFLVTVIAFELKDEGGSDVEVRTLATTLMGATMKESTFPGAKEPYKRKRTMIEFFFLL